MVEPVFVSCLTLVRSNGGLILPSSKIRPCRLIRADSWTGSDHPVDRVGPWTGPDHPPPPTYVCSLLRVLAGPDSASYFQLLQKSLKIGKTQNTIIISSKSKTETKLNMNQTNWVNYWIKPSVNII
jgi:hypothetical protein